MEITANPFDETTEFEIQLRERVAELIEESSVKYKEHLTENFSEAGSLYIEDTIGKYKKSMTDIHKDYVISKINSITFIKKLKHSFIRDGEIEHFQESLERELKAMGTPILVNF